MTTDPTTAISRRRRPRGRYPKTQDGVRRVTRCEVLGIKTETHLRNYAWSIQLKSDRKEWLNIACWLEAGA